MLNHIPEREEGMEGHKGGEKRTSGHIPPGTYSVRELAIDCREPGESHLYPPPCYAVFPLLEGEPERLESFLERTGSSRPGG